MSRAAPVAAAEHNSSSPAKERTTTKPSYGGLWQCQCRGEDWICGRLGEPQYGGGVAQRLVATINGVSRRNLDFSAGYCTGYH